MKGLFKFIGQCFVILVIYACWQTSIVYDKPTEYIRNMDPHTFSVFNMVIPSDLMSEKTYNEDTIAVRIYEYAREDKSMCIRDTLYHVAYRKSIIHRMSKGGAYVKCVPTLLYDGQPDSSEYKFVDTGINYVSLDTITILYNTMIRTR